MALRELLATFDVKVDDAQLTAFNARLQATIDRTKGAQASWGNLQKEFAARAPKGISNVSGEMRNVEFAAQGASQGIAGALGGLVAAFGGARLVGLLRGAATEAVAAGSKIQDTVERLGVGAEDLQRLAYAAEQTGGSFEGAANALKFLSKNLADAKAGGEGAKVFKELKVSATDASGAIRPTTDVIADLADSFAALPAAERVGKAMEIFGRGGLDMIPILAKGSAGVREMTGELDALGGVLDGRAVAALDDLGDEGVRLQAVFRGIRNRLVVDLAPGLLAFMERVKGAALWLSRLLQNTNAAKIGLLGMAGAIGVMGIKAAQAFGIITKFQPGVMGFFRGIAGAALPAIAVALALAAIALAAEDVYTWLTGGKSVIGQFLEKTYGIEAANAMAQDFRNTFEEIWKTLQESGPAMAQLGSELLKAFAVALPYIIQGMQTVSQVIAGTVKAIAELVSIATAVPGAIKSGDLSGIKASVGRVADLFSTDTEKTGGGAAIKALRDNNHSTAGFVPRTGGEGQLVAGPVVPRSPESFERGPTTVQQSNEINVTVQGGPEAKETARRIGVTVRDATTEANNRAAAAAIGAGY